jgi:hypothetical protein
VAQRVNAPEVLHVLKLMLKVAGKQGVAQGRVLSPLLSHLSLTVVAQMLERAKEVTKSAEKPRRSGRGWIGVGRAGLNAQEPNNTHAVPEPSMGEGAA